MAKKTACYWSFVKVISFKLYSSWDQGQQKARKKKNTTIFMLNFSIRGSIKRRWVRAHPKARNINRRVLSIAWVRIKFYFLVFKIYFLFLVKSLTFGKCFGGISDFVFLSTSPPNALYFDTFYLFCPLLGALTQGGPTSKGWCAIWLDRPGLTWLILKKNIYWIILYIYINDMIYKASRGLVLFIFHSSRITRRNIGQFP